MSDGGKGDTQRPTDKKAFDENLEKIFGVKVPWYVRRDREQRQDNVERCPSCCACINSACGREECPKGWPAAIIEE